MNPKTITNMIYLELLKIMTSTMKAGKPIPDHILKLAVHYATAAAVPEEEIAMMEIAATHPNGRLH
jgi:hypothetical protein